MKFSKKKKKIVHLWLLLPSLLQICYLATDDVVIFQIIIMYFAKYFISSAILYRAKMNEFHFITRLFCFV